MLLAKALMEERYQKVFVHMKDIVFHGSKLEDARIEFLKSVGYDYEVFSQYIPEEYQEISDFVWESVIKGIVKKVEKNEDLLVKNGFSNFAISGHTEGKEFCPWQMFDKSRYLSMIKR